MAYPKNIHEAENAGDDFLKDTLREMTQIVDKQQRDVLGHKKRRYKEGSDIEARYARGEL